MSTVTTNAIPASLSAALRAFRTGAGTLVVLTGAGISAESGIPTFRGTEGYWVAGSRNYQPEEMATLATFSRQPELVWGWYLYRRGVCGAATPNAGHRAVLELEQLLGDRFLLITQNVDGLHLRAGNSAERTYQIHGNIDFARCARECGAPIWRLDEQARRVGRDASPLSDSEQALLRCPGCGGWARPHVLWFDECYDEEHFRFDSSIAAARRAAVLLVVGTSGATNLPMHVGALALEAGALIVDVNPEPNPFSRMAGLAERGFCLQGSAAAVLPAIVEALR